ncbi:MAG: response regulator transcription factor [Bacillota bacterium]
MNNTIMVVDDDSQLREVVRVYLNKNGFQVIEAEDGRVAVKKFWEFNPALIVLDLMLPNMDGWDVCRELRKTSRVPIIMLTARSEEFDRVLGLELGADDYLAKPFSPRELVARIKAVLRRINVEPPEKEFLSFPGLEIDYASHRVMVNSQEIVLSPKEFDILWLLSNNAGRLLSREQILEKVWGYTYLGDVRTVDTHIKRLREKLSALNYQCIKTVWGAGYKFEVGHHE